MLYNYFRIKLTEVDRTKYLIIDDETPAVSKIKKFLTQLSYDADITTFSTVSGFTESECKQYNYAFLDYNCYSEVLEDLIVERSPDCRIIVIVGYTGKENMYGSTNKKIFLRKPFSLSTLKKAIS